MPISLKIIFLGFIIGISFAAPLWILSYFSDTYQPCGDTWAGIGCALGFGLFGFLITYLLVIIGMAKLILVLTHNKVKNVEYIIGSSVVLYYFILPLTGINDYTIPFSAINIILVPLILLCHYVLFGKMRLTAFGMRPVIISLFFWVVLIALVIAFSRVSYTYLN